MITILLLKWRKVKKVSQARHRKKDVHTNIMIVEKKMIHTKKNFH